MTIEDEARGALEAWNQAFNRGDAAGVAALYLADAQFLPASHEVVVGPAAIEAFFRPMLAQGVTDHANAVIICGGEGALVYVASRWTVRSPRADGGSETSSGFATHLLERQPDGNLKIRLHTFN